MKNHNDAIIRGHTVLHRDHAVVERFNRTFADRFFGYQYANEFIQDKRSREWVKILPGVITVLNNEITRTINMKYNDAFKKKYIPVQPQKDFSKQPILGNVTVRYLYEPVELEGGTTRATDPIWSIATHKISSITRSTGRPAIYGFTRQQLQLIPDDTKLPPRGLN